jgi:hypothetical protein
MGATRLQRHASGTRGRAARRRQRPRSASADAWHLICRSDGMKRTYYYRWRFHIDGPATTVDHYTAEDFARHFPGAIDATPLEKHPRITQEPEGPEEERECWANYYWSLEPEDRAAVPADLVEHFDLMTFPRLIRRAIP